MEDNTHGFPYQDRQSLASVKQYKNRRLNESKHLENPVKQYKNRRLSESKHLKNPVKQYKNRRLSEGKHLENPVCSTGLTEFPEKTMNEDFKLCLGDQFTDMKSTYYKPCEITVLNDDEMACLLNKVINRTKSFNVSQLYLFDFVHKGRGPRRSCDALMSGEDVRPFIDAMDVKIIDPISNFRWTNLSVNPLPNLDIFKNRTRKWKMDNYINWDEHHLANLNETHDTTPTKPTVSAPKDASLHFRLFYDIRGKETEFIDSTPPILCVCTICGETFTDNFNFSEHKKEHRRKPILLKQDVKRKPGSPKKSFDKRVLRINKNKQKLGLVPKFKCLQCNKSFPSKQCLKNHQRRLICSKPFKCGMCRKRFSLKINLEEHLKVHDPKKPHLCVFCGESFKATNQLKDHLFQHTGIPNFHCSECKEEFCSESDWKQHKKVTHPKFYTCSHCDIQFSCKTTIISHMISNHSSGGFECNQCGKMYPTEISLTNHIETHSDIKCYLCEHCGKAFNAITALRYHLSSHRRKPSQCPVCNKSFTTKAKMMQHLNLHTGEEKYPCPVCKRIFLYKSNLSRHHKLCLNGKKNNSALVKSYQCEICERWYSTRASLYSHSYYTHKKKIQSRRSTTLRKSTSPK